MRKMIFKSEMKLLRISLALLGIFSFQFFLSESKKESASVSVEETEAVFVETRKCNFFEEKLFFIDDERVRSQEISDKNVIRGGIVPHHLLPSFIISDLFYRLSFQDIKTIVLIGPNHYELGGNSIVTSDVDWETPFGRVESDLVIEKLLEDGGIKKDNSFIESEHSIAGLIPFVDYYLPKVKIVSLVVRQNMSNDEMENVVNLLAEITKNPEIVVVASVDFSHYLFSVEAQEKNKETRKALEGKDYEQLLIWNNEHLDSPQSVLILMQVMDKIGANKMTILNDTDSGQLTGDPSSESTSYFEITFE